MCLSEPVRQTLLVIPCPGGELPARSLAEELRRIRPRWRIESPGSAAGNTGVADVVVPVFAGSEGPGELIGQVLAEPGVRERVVPVVLGAGRMPRQDEVPASLSWLAFVNAVVASDAATAAAAVAAAVEGRPTLAEPLSPSGLVRSTLAHAFVPMCFGPLWALLALAAALAVTMTAAMVMLTGSGNLDSRALGGLMALAIPAAGIAYGALLGRRIGCLGALVGAIGGALLPWTALALVAVGSIASFVVRTRVLGGDMDKIGPLDKLLFGGAPCFIAASLLYGGWLARRRERAGESRRTRRTSGMMAGLAGLIAAAAGGVATLLLFRGRTSNLPNDLVALVVLMHTACAGVLMGLLRGAFAALDERFKDLARPRGVPTWALFAAGSTAVLFALAPLLWPAGAWVLAMFGWRAHAAAGMVAAPALLIAVWSLARRAKSRRVPRGRARSRWLVVASIIGLASGLQAMLLWGGACAPKDEAQRLARVGEFFEFSLGFVRLNPGASRSLAETLVRLADVRTGQGRAAEAESLLTEAAEAWRRLQPTPNLELAFTLNRLAVVIEAQGRTDEAATYYELALAEYCGAESAAGIDLAVLLANVGSAKLRLGRKAEAEPLLSEALAIKRRESAPDVPAAVRQLAVLRRDLGMHAEAEPLFAELLERARQDRTADGAGKIIEALDHLAWALRLQHRPHDADALFEESLHRTRELLGVEHASVAVSLFNLGLNRLEAGRFAEAEQSYSEALAMYRRLGADESADVLPCLRGLIRAREGRGAAAEAEPLYAEVVEIRRRSGGPLELAAALQQLGRARSRLHRWADAEAPLREAEAMYREAAGEHPFLAATLGDLGDVLANTGRPDEAIEKYAESAARFERLDRPGDVNQAFALQRLAYAAGNAGRYAEAEGAIVRALALLRRSHPGDHALVARAISDTADLKRIQGLHENAAALYVDAIAMYQRLPALEPGIIATFRGLAESLRALGKLASAAEASGSAVAAARSLGTAGVDLADLLNDFGVDLLVAGKAREALPVLEGALRVRRAEPGGDSLPLANAINNVGGAWRDVGECAKAEDFFREAVAMARRLAGGDDPGLANSLSNLALCLHRQGKADEARTAIDEASTMIGRLQPGGPLERRILDRRTEILGE